MTGSDKYTLLVSHASRTRKMAARERSAEPAPEVDALETTLHSLLIVVAFVVLLVLMSR